MTYRFPQSLKALYAAYQDADFTLPTLADKVWIPRGFSGLGIAWIEFRSRTRGPHPQFDPPGHPVFRVSEAGNWIGKASLRDVLPEPAWSAWVCAADRAIVPVKTAYRAEVRYVSAQQIAREDRVPAIFRIQRAFRPDDYPSCNACRSTSHPLDFETAVTLQHDLMCPRCGSVDITWTEGFYRDNQLLRDRAYVAGI